MSADSLSVQMLFTQDPRFDDAERATLLAALSEIVGAPVVEMDSEDEDYYAPDQRLFMICADKMVNEKRPYTATYEQLSSVEYAVDEMNRVMEDAGIHPGGDNRERWQRPLWIVYDHQERKLINFVWSMQHQEIPLG